jgi:hypothetical protein
LGEGDGVVERHEATGGCANQVKAVDAEMLHEALEIVGGRAGLRPGRLNHCSAPAPPIECDESVPGRGECANLVLPIFHVARRRVHEHNWHTAAARICVPQPNARKVDS